LGARAGEYTTKKHEGKTAHREIIDEPFSRNAQIAGGACPSVVQIKKDFEVCGLYIF